MSTEEKVEVKPEVKAEVKDGVKAEEVKVEVKPEVKPEVKAEVKDKEDVLKEDENKKPEKPKIKLSKFADIFVTESDTFDILVKYYKKDGDLIVCEVDDAFNK